jgi:tetratricopeptide (TPR) repeat protein
MAVATLPTVDVPVTSEERNRIAALMERAESYLASGATETAIEQWIAVLNIRVDHETALRSATGYLWRLSYRDDARELVQRALDAGSQVPSIYMTAIDIAERLGEHDSADELRDRVASLSQVDDQLLITLADDYIQRYRMEEALAFLDRALQTHPASQKLLIKMGDLLKQLDRSSEAVTYYERAIRSGARTAEGKEADQKLALFVPVLTDRERGSVWAGAARDAWGWDVVTGYGMAGCRS